MMILLRLDPTDEAGLRAYRLQVKERLYRFNFARHFLPAWIFNLIVFQETLAQLEKDERFEKLEETFHSVIDDYHRILAFVS